jgi:hypothetical protein
MAFWTRRSLWDVSKGFIACRLEIFKICIISKELLMNLRRIIVAAAFLAAIGFCTAAQAEIWNMAADLHASVTGGAPVNPNGAWTYGYSPSVGGEFAADTAQTDGSAWWAAGITNGWSKTDNPYLPAIWSVLSDTTALGAVPVAAGEMVIHPGTGLTECGVVRWTAPATGSYDVTASWESINGMAEYAYNAGVDVHLLKNGVSIYDGVTSYLTATGPATMGSTILSLTAGDTLDFVTSPLGADLYDPASLSYAADMTRVSATITSVPEPGTLVLLGGSLLGLLVCAWRKR